MHRIFQVAVIFLALCGVAHAAGQARSESIEAVGKLVFTPGSGYSLDEIEYTDITITAPGSGAAEEHNDAAAAKKLKVHLRVAESKSLVRDLDALTGKRVLVKGPSFAAPDSVTHDIEAGGKDFSITPAAEAPAEKPAGGCAADADCRPACKGAGKGSECEPDGIPFCLNHQCNCELNCL